MRPPTIAPTPMPIGRAIQLSLLSAAKTPAPIAPAPAAPVALPISTHLVRSLIDEHPETIASAPIESTPIFSLFLTKFPLPS